MRSIPGGRRMLGVMVLLAATAWLPVTMAGAPHHRLSRHHAEFPTDSQADAIMRPHAAYSEAAVTSARVRTEDSRLRELLAEGLGASPTLRRLVERLDGSDVVVYVKCDQQLRDRVAGRMAFVSAAAGTRYVQARVGYQGGRAHQIALIGHELQHAVEVAETPAIVDVRSFDREYRRMGFISRAGSGSGDVAYETNAAMATGEQVLRELVSSTD